MPPAVLTLLLPCCLLPASFFLYDLAGVGVTPKPYIGLKVRRHRHVTTSCLAMATERACVPVP